MTNKNPKIIFIGASEFALPALKALIKNDYNIAAVITSPDKPVGRNHKITPSPVKQTALKYKLPILRLEQISDLKPDLIIVSAYGKIIPKNILDIPCFGCLNIHPSLLPKYRGPSPIQTAILNGDKKTGVTIMLMDEKMDHGPVIAQKEIDIGPEDNYQTLEKKISEQSSDFLIQTLPQYLNNEIEPQKQNEDEASYTEILTREHGRIDLNKNAEEIERMTKAFYPWPGAWIYLNKKRVKILKAKAVKSKSAACLQTKNGFLLLEMVQPQGKKPMTGEEFFRGYKP